MRDIAYFMTDEREYKDRRQRIFAEHVVWQERRVELYRIPPSFLKGKGGIRAFAGRKEAERLKAQIEGEAKMQLWTAPELDGIWKDFRQPVPDALLAAYIWRQQPFRENLVILSGEEGQRWQEDFVEEAFGQLNGLYLIGKEDTFYMEELAQRIYEDSGLLISFLSEIPETDGRRTTVVELRKNARPPVRSMAFGCLYLDMTSDPAKKRLIVEKRTDISYISVRNYLDTAFKARYNAI